MSMSVQGRNPERITGCCVERGRPSRGGSPPTPSRGSDFGEESVHVPSQLVRLMAEVVGGGEHLRGGRTGLLGHFVHTRDIGGHAIGALRHQLNIVGYVTRGGALLFDCRRDRRSDLVHLANGAADGLDRIYRMSRLVLDSGD